MKKYVPKPTDTSDIVIPDDLMPLMEDLAKNVHEVWAQNRINEGWKYGPVRDDAEKRHPSLVEYEKLSEEEKDYDRATSRETLKFILKSGHSISK